MLIIDKSEKLYQEIQELYQERDELVKAVESLEDPLENIVMRLFYIDGLSWNEIQIRLRCGRGTIHRARDSALKKLSKKWN